MIDMFRFLKNLKGNAKTCLVLDPLWTIPFNLFAPFATMYMFALGLGDVEIGLLLSIGMVCNFFIAIIGGVVTDKFGRRKMIIFADFVAWSIPVLIWAFAQNFWWFLAAALFNSIMHIGVVAFECSWVDDLEEKYLANAINWFHILFLSAVFASLISGFFVERYSLVPVMRILYLAAFIIMTTRVVLLIIFLKETERGKERMEAVKGISVLSQLSGLKDVFLQVIRSRPMRRVLIMLPMASIFQMIMGTFFALYATQELEIGEYFLAYFPVIRAGVSLLFYFFIQNKLGHFKLQNLMAFGLGLFIIGHVLLLTAPPQNIPWLLVYALMDAWAAALFWPRMDNMLFASVDPTERARCRSVINVVVLAMTSPFGLLAGLLSDMDRRLPFVLNMILFLCMMIFITRPQKDAVKA